MEEVGSIATGAIIAKAQDLAMAVLKSSRWSNSVLHFNLRTSLFCHFYIDSANGTAQVCIYRSLIEELKEFFALTFRVKSDVFQ